MNVRLIVPRRGDMGWRDKLWKFCREYWQRERPEWEVVEGDHTGGHFNRSAAINLAAEGRWDVGVILDADTLLDVDQVEAGIVRAARTGRLILPFEERAMLNRQGTQHILRGGTGRWERWELGRQTLDDAYEYISGCQVVPRVLFDRVRGFDERFEGWGGEDDAFHAACLAGGGYDPKSDRLPGTAWHLWHRTSPAANTRSTTWKLARGLADRYIDAQGDWGRMEALLAEDRGADQIVIVCLTTGDRDTLERTIESADKKLRGRIGRKLLAVDAPRTDLEFPGWDIVPMGRSKGYAVATGRAYELAMGSGQPWIFWLEDDFEFPKRVDLDAMRRTLEENSHLAQLTLLRQPWYENEIEAGGIIEAAPRKFSQRDGYVQHRAYWAQNPMMVHRAFVAENPWPQRANAELAHGRRVFRDNRVFGGIVGKIGDPPRCIHLGTDRAGFRY